MNTFKPGDLVACYLTNTEIIGGLFQWGIVLEVSPTLEDVLVLDNGGYTNWYKSTRWTTLDTPVKQEKKLDINAILA